MLPKDPLRVIMMGMILSCITSFSAFSQTTLTGKISTREGTSLQGVSIINKTTKTVTITDSEGRFTLKATQGDVIEISYVGYQSQQTVLGNEADLRVTLHEDVTMLNEVVVAGYGSINKRDLTGSIESVSEKDFNRGNYTSPDQLLQGRVAGVQITNNSGQPGVASTIKIRGNSVLTGTGQPLFVVDGVPLSGSSARPNTDDGESPMGNPLNFLNPSDIATIDVLKDASATAIYGSRAAYGVIIITTKKGQAGEPRLDFSASGGVASIQNKLQVLNANQYRQAIQYYGVNPYNDKGGSADALGSILRKAKQQNYSLGLSGGNADGKYRFSFGYYDQEGIIAKSEIKKYNAGLSANLSFLDNKKLAFDINVLASQYLETIPPIRNGFGVVGYALVWNPTESLRDPNGALNIQIGEFNPLALSELHDDKSKVTTILASLAPSYQFTDWLELKMLASVNYGSGVRRYSINQDFKPWTSVGFANINNNENQTTQFTSMLSFHKDIFSEMNLSAVGGFEYMKFINKGSAVGVSGPDPMGFGQYGLDYTNYIQYSNPSNRKVSSFADPITELQSYLVRAILNYKERYLLTATFRADGSTKFGDNNKYGYFPSFSAAWIVSEENFLNSNFINFLKLRAGWGRTGNQEFPAGAATTLYGFYENGVIAQINNPNPDLKWQADVQLNIGFDFAVSNNRISGTIDFFKKTTTDLLYPSYPIQPAPSNATITWLNMDGKIENTGVEVTLTAKLIEQANFSWNFGLNTTLVRNKVSGLPAPIQTGWATGGALVQIIDNGIPMNTFYTRKFLGIDENGIGQYENEGVSMHNFGSPNPTALLGINSVIQYKKLSLLVNMYGAFGQYIYNNTHNEILNVPGINFGRNILLSDFQSPAKESIYNAVTSSSRFIEKGDYLKMGNVTLSYDVARVGQVFKQTRLYFTAQNLFTITGYSGFNPEVNINRNNNGVPSLGIDHQPYPLARSFILGLNFTL